MNNIKIKQELPENLRLLKAQRVIYSQAKNIYKWQLTITILVVILLNFMKIFQKNISSIDLTPYIALVSIIITLIDLLFLSDILSTYKKNAAKTQELFDCSVYNMDWNQTNCGEKPENWIIENASNKYIHNPKAPLTNWYHISLDGLAQEEAILRCQETNLEYDRKLRYHFKNDCTIVALIVVTLSFIIATIINASIQGYLTNFFAPTLPLLVILFKLILDNQKAVKSLEEVRKAARILGNSDTLPTLHQLRQVQDKLFCSRKDSVLIPENYYTFRRDKLEKSTESNISNNL
ncbi:S-4TM family putative pore-forming effector [Chryseobacterium oncorhynchi]|uniref:Uncharacterized protein n=1 Tax=Chryseobacterium oncorhynchi TaxID=741074 RepID=A0A316X4I4_9FLAO|nr:S-4TM family putative pore-forming effector [Chryseobacterium oncorhynchi]PWN67676.1 hypothetical protein C1638_003535 [Chryseobacterium oncorhynchi]